MAWLTAVALSAGASACPGADEVRSLLDNLANPCGIAIQPGTGHVFVSESGAGRILRVADGRPEEVVVGFGKELYGEGPAYAIGPLGLAFVNQNTLVVGGGDLPDGEDLLRVFQISPAGSPAVRASAAVASFRLPAAGETRGEGNFYGVAATERAVFVTCHGDDAKGWLGRAIVKSGQLVSFDRFVATKEATGVNAPGGVTISPRGEIVVGQLGKRDVAHDAVVAFYSAADGQRLLSLEAGLYDITALAYGPDGQLYATDFAWMRPEEGGLFQLMATIVGGKQAVQARKVQRLDKPTALACAPDGSLYVTVFGTAEQGSDRKPGKLLRISLPQPASER